MDAPCAGNHQKGISSHKIVFLNDSTELVNKRDQLKLRLRTVLKKRPAAFDDSNARAFWALSESPWLKMYTRGV